MTIGTVVEMRRPGPPQTCYTCCHESCERKRREARLVCANCERRIVPGETFRPVTIVNGEIVTAIHNSACERRVGQ